ncbi:haloalkane dehalogenase [compost metagenome]
MKKKVASFVLAAVMSLSVSAAVFANPIAGQDYQGLVDVNGVNLYVDIQGSANRDQTEPAVIFENGRLDEHTVWSAVQPVIAQTTQTLSYDRADIGQSDPGTGSYDAISQAQELHALLQEANIAAPYVLVTHSHGSSITRVFADLYPTEVVGVAFIDAAHEDQEALITDTMPQALQDVYKSQFVKEGGYAAVLTGLAQAGATVVNDPFRTIPIAVVSADDHRLGPVVEATWAALQAEIVTWSNFSTHTVATGSYHFVMIDQPQVVIDAIESLLY